MHIYIGPEAVVYSDKQVVHHSEDRVFISLLPLFSYQLSNQLSVIISVSVSTFIISVISYHLSYQLSVIRSVSVLSFIVLSFSCFAYQCNSNVLTSLLPVAFISQCR